MEFAEERAGNVVIVRLAGRLDSAAAPAAEASFARLIGDGAARLAVDLSALQYVSSAGLRVLLVVAKKVQQAEGKVVLFALPPNVREVFATTGFDRIFAIAADAAGAVAAAG